MAGPRGYYEVEIIFKAGFQTRVYADNGTDAFAKALEELQSEETCFLDVISNHVVGEWEPEAVMRRASRRASSEADDHSNFGLM